MLVDNIQAPPPTRSIGKPQGIVISCVALIAISSLIGHAIDQTELTHWGGPWELTKPTAVLYLLLCAQSYFRKIVPRYLLAYITTLAAIATLASDYQGYSFATGTVQTCLAVSLLLPRKSYLSLLAIPAAWTCILGISTLLMKADSGLLAGFVKDMSLPTAACGLSLVYLTLKEAEPYAFRHSPFRPIHLAYAAGIIALAILLPILIEVSGHKYSGLVISFSVLSIGCFVVLQRFENRRLDHRNRDLLSALDKTAIVTMTNVQGEIVHINEAFSEQYGYARSEILGKKHTSVSSGLHDKDFWKNIWDTINHGKSWKGEICNKTKQGDLIWLDSTIFPLSDERGDPELFLAIYFDITERKQQAEHLEKSQEEQRVVLESLQAMTAHRDGLVRLIAHDLRSPIASIIATAELAKETDSQLTPESVRSISQNARKAISELDDFLSAEAQFHDLHEKSPREPFDPGLEALEEWQTHRFAAEQKGITIHFTQTKPLEFIGYRQLYVHVLRNLLSNAIKYTPESGQIEVGISLGKDGLTLRVEDSGKGIPKWERSKLFEPFQHGKDSQTKSTSHKSWGLGLSIVRELLKTQQGSISIHDSALGGAKFEAFFPAK